MIRLNALLSLIFLTFLTIFFYIIQRKRSKNYREITNAEIEKLNFHDKMLLNYLNDNRYFLYYKNLFESFKNKKIFSICPEAFLNILFYPISKKMYLLLIAEFLIFLAPKIYLEFKVLLVSLIPFVFNYLFYLKFKYKYEFSDQYYKTDEEKLSNMENDNKNLKKIKILIFISLTLTTVYFTNKARNEYNRLIYLQEFRNNLQKLQQ